MTRINLIPPKLLTDQHLQAEHREIKRLPKNYIKWLKSKSQIPEKFCLGTGHVLFFLNKGLYTFNRYCELHTECLKRGFNVTDYRSSWLHVEVKDYLATGMYFPTEEDKQLVIERINERMEANPEFYKYYGKPISINQYKKLISKNKL